MATSEKNNPFATFCLVDLVSVPDSSCEEVESWVVAKEGSKFIIEGII